jgi:hypothetical protein
MAQRLSVREGIVKFLIMKNGMRSLAFAFLGATLLVGCAETPPVSEEINFETVKSQIPAGNSLLYVVRPAAYSGSANLYKMSINGTHVLDLKTGTYFSYLVPAGEVRVNSETVPSILNFGLALAFMGKPELTFKTDEKEIYFIDVEVGFSGGPVLSKVESSVGESLVRKAKKVQVQK